MSSEANFKTKDELEHINIVERLAELTEEYNSNLKCVVNSQGRKRRVFIPADIPILVNSMYVEENLLGR
jgi:hypothetical protein